MLNNQRVSIPAMSRKNHGVIWPELRLRAETSSHWLKSWWNTVVLWPALLGCTKTRRCLAAFDVPCLSYKCIYSHIYIYTDIYIYRYIYIYMCVCRFYNIYTYIYIYIYMKVSWSGGAPKSSISMGFSIINHLFWVSTIYGNHHRICTYIYICYIDMIAFYTCNRETCLSIVSLIERAWWLEINPNWIK